MSEMNEEAQRVAIAEAMGWKQGAYLSGSYCAIPPNGGTCDNQPIPDYLNDLNACADFERAMDRTTRRFYVVELICVIEETDKDSFFWPLYGPDSDLCFYLVTATAKQRCEAFLRCEGKWEVKP